MADTVKATDPAPEPSDDVLARIDQAQGRESDYTRGEITADTGDHDIVTTGKGGIRHFDGTVVKVNRDGERVLSSYVDPDAGEKLAIEVEAEEEAAKAEKARKHGPQATAGKSPDVEAGGTVTPPADNSGAGTPGVGGTKDSSEKNSPPPPPVVTSLGE